MNWSPLQHEALEAMGFAVYRMPGAEAVSRTDATPPARSADASNTAPVSRPAMPRPVAPPRPGTDAGAGVDRLRAALSRAAGGVDPAALSALIGEGDAAARLRGDPAAKRALWPRLRALRRAGA